MKEDDKDQNLDKAQDLTDEEKVFHTPTPPLTITIGPSTNGPCGGGSVL